MAAASALQVFDVQVEEWLVPGRPTLRSYTSTEALGDIFRGTSRAHAVSVPGIAGSAGFGPSHLLWPFWRYGGLIDPTSSSLRLLAVARELDPHKKAILSEDFALGLTYRLAERRGVRAVVTKAELQSQAAQRFLAQMSGIRIPIIRAVASSVSGGLAGADFIGITTSGVWEVIEAKGHQRSAGAKPFDPSAIILTRSGGGPASLRKALDQAKKTARQVAQARVPQEAFASFCWIGSQMPQTSTVVQLVDPRPEDPPNSEEVAHVMSALRQFGPAFHYQWIANLLRADFEWGATMHLERLAPRPVGNLPLEGAFVRTVALRSEEGGVEVTMGLDPRAVRAISEGSIEALGALPEELPPGLGSDGLIVDVRLTS